MASALRRALQALGIWLAVLLAVAVTWPAALHLPQLWMMVAAGILANSLQPAYKPFEGSRTAEDRGTAAQILWTVYLTQAAALLELILRKRMALPLDATMWIALCAMTLGLGLRTWAVLALGPWFTWNIETQAGQQLISHGPYRLMRHPSYTGALLTFVASCVLLRSWVTAVLAFAGLTAAFLRRIRHEEALLVRTLPGYESYMNHTGKLLPRVFAGQARA